MKPTEKQIELISSADIFSLANKSLLKSILTDGGVVVGEYKKNDIIYGKNNYIKAVGVIIKGSASVTKAQSGAVISTLNTGDIFGCVSLFSSKDYYVNDIVAISDTKVIFIAKSTCEKLLKQDSEFSIGFIEYLSDRLYFLNTRIESFTANNAETKVVSYLLSRFEGEKTTEITLSMSRLAQTVNIARVSVYRAVQSLCDKGIIVKEGKNIKVENIEKLKEVLSQ